MALKVGDKAPEFNLKDSFEKDVSLKDFKGCLLYTSDAADE